MLYLCIRYGAVLDMAFHIFDGTYRFKTVSVGSLFFLLHRADYCGQEYIWLYYMFVAVRYDITNRCSAVFVTTIFLDLFVVIGHAGKIPCFDSDIWIMAANISKLHSVQYPTYLGHFPAPLAPNFDRVCVELLCTCHQYSEFKMDPQNLSE